MSCPLVRPNQTHLGRSARAPVDRGPWGFGEGVVDSDHSPGRSALRTLSASTALGWVTWAGARLPMHMNVPGRQNRSSSTQRAHSPRKIAPYPGHAPFWARRGARRNLGVRFRLIRAVSTRQTTQSCIDPAFWAEQCWRLADGRARTLVARSNARGAPAGSGPRCRGAVPADPDVLWC